MKKQTGETKHDDYTSDKALPCNLFSLASQLSGLRVNYYNQAAEQAKPIADLQSLSQQLPRIATVISDCLGSTQLESTYKRALKYELEKVELEVILEPEISVYYEGRVIGSRCVDLIVQLKLQKEKAIIAIKAVPELHRDHMEQLQSCMAVFNIHHGFLINFAHLRYASNDDSRVFSTQWLLGKSNQDMDASYKNHSKQDTLAASQMVSTVQVVKVDCRAVPRPRKGPHVDEQRLGLAVKMNETDQSGKVNVSATVQFAKWGVTHDGYPCKVCNRLRRYCQVHIRQKLAAKNSNQKGNP